MKPYKNDIWNIWTNKSNNISFKSSTKSIGDGEHKLAAEYNTTPLGQNSNYDLDILGEKWEVKKLDSDSSFRLGVEVLNDYTSTVSALIRILEKLPSINTSLQNAPSKLKIIECINQVNSVSSKSKTKF